MGVFYDRDFEDQLGRLRVEADRLDEAISFVEYQLSENPDSGIQSGVPGIYVAPVRLPSEDGLARFSIFYTYDGKDVTFRLLRRAR